MCCAQLCVGFAAGSTAFPLAAGRLASQQANPTSTATDPPPKRRSKGLAALKIRTAELTALAALRRGNELAEILAGYGIRKDPC